jgi:hypothetical protein
VQIANKMGIKNMRMRTISEVIFQWRADCDYFRFRVIVENVTLLNQTDDRRVEWMQPQEEPSKETSELAHTKRELDQRLPQIEFNIRQGNIISQVMFLPFKVLLINLVDILDKWIPIICLDVENIIRWV